MAGRAELRRACWMRGQICREKITFDRSAVDHPRLAPAYVGGGAVFVHRPVLALHHGRAAGSDRPAVATLFGEGSDRDRGGPLVTGFLDGVEDAVEDVGGMFADGVEDGGVVSVDPVEDDDEAESTPTEDDGDREQRPEFWGDEVAVCGDFEGEATYFGRGGAAGGGEKCGAAGGSPGMCNRRVGVAVRDCVRVAVRVSGGHMSSVCCGGL